MGSRIEIARAFVQARRRMGWSREQIERWHSAHTVPEAEYPIDTAAEFERQFAARNALGLTLEEARVEAARELAGEAPRYAGYSFGFSTGTTGASGVFLTNAAERNRWIGTILGKLLPLRLLAGAKIALVLKFNNRLYTDVGQTRRLQFEYFEAATPTDAWAERLCVLAPDVLVGPTSILEAIGRSAAFARRPFRPMVVLAGAEPTFPQDAELLECAYGVRPRAVYQAKEGFLAAGCAHGRVHLNEDLICFERVDIGRGRFVPVITDFTRTSQMYRRFRLDDVLLAAEGACPCGQALAAIEAVEGRAMDVLLRGSELVFPLEVNEALRPSLNGADYRVSQTGPEELSVAVEGGATAAHGAALADLMPRARVTFEAYAAPVPGEKRRRVRRLFDLQNDWLNRFTISRNRRSGQ